MAKMTPGRMLVGVPLLLALATALVVVAWLQSAGPVHASHGTIRVAAVGGNFGMRAADTICNEGDVDCTITRINSASTFNSMTPAQLQDNYDVLLITWGASRRFDFDWNSRLRPFMALGGGVIWEDPNNVEDISDIASTGGGFSWPPDITATVPGLTDGVVGGSPSSFANNHTVFSAWDTGLSPFMTGSGGTGVLGLWGHAGTGGCIVLQGPDADFHANRTGSFFVEQYELLANEITFVSHTCTPSTPPNRPPTANANGPYSVNEGGAALLSGSGTDPDGDPLTYSWDLDNNGSFETAGQNPTFSATGLDGPSAQTVTLQVCDPSNACDTEDSTMEINNVAPVGSMTNDAIEESDSALLTVTFSDVGSPDTHTAVVDWGEGTVAALGAVTSPFNISQVYGDNGVFAVTVTVTDDDAGIATVTGTVTVVNIDPTLTFDTSSSIGFAGGNAFVGRKGVEQTHSAESTDAGSDDLTFDWEFNPDTTAAANPHYNDGVGPEPALPSPHGVFPASASDSASVTFTMPGIYTVSVKVSDDDGGSDADSLDKIVTDDCDCTRSKGFWKQQFKEREPKDDKKVEKGQLISEDTLSIYLDIVNYASGVFGEIVPLSSLADANSVFNPPKPDKDEDAGHGKDKDSDKKLAKKREDALQQALAAWLNFARGAVGWDEDIIVEEGEDEGTMEEPAVVLPFSEVIAQVEAILTNPLSTADDFEHASDLAESANKHGKDDRDTDSGSDEGTHDTKRDVPKRHGRSSRIG